MKKRSFAEQEIVLGKTPLINKLPKKRFIIPNQFYSEGYVVIEDVNNIKSAQEVTEQLIAHIDTEKLPLWNIFLPRVQLAKIDEIPVCTDVVEGSYQVLHLDMGQPIISDIPQDMYLVTALYRDKGKPQTLAKTRIMSLKGFFKDKKWGGKKQIEKRLIEYAQEYGDGWFYPVKVSTQRLACFARILDAVAGTTELSQDIAKTMGQWFRDKERLGADESMKNEYEFYAKRGINLAEFEEFIQLKPGQLLIFDNTRVTHGRAGKRQAREVWQIMYGVKDATSKDINKFREHFVELLTDPLRKEF